MQQMRLPPINALQLATAKDFRGGLNTFDTPLNLASRYVTQCTNLYPDNNGRLRIRYGTTPFADLTLSIDNIVGMEYYAGAIIVVGANGVIVSIDATGTATVRWNNTIAALLPGAPTGWSTGLVFASFTQFSGQLIICNGVDKPVSMDELYAVTYVQDPGTGSNANVPRAKYCTTHDRHLIFAVTPTDTFTIFVSSIGTTTFYGDPTPATGVNAFNYNTAVHIDRGVPIITGLVSYRDRLIITFQENVVIFNINDVDPTTNLSSVTAIDAISSHGGISHKTLIPLGDDLLISDTVGVSSIRRSTISNDITPTRISTLISTDIQKSLAKLTNTELANHVYAVHDRVAQHVLLFIPTNTGVTVETPNDVYVYCYDKATRFGAWTRFASMPYRAACRSTEGRIFFGTGDKVVYYHNDYEPIYGDFTTYSQQAWDDATMWSDGTGWIDITLLTPTPTMFSFILPWTDFKHPLRNKASKYVSVLAEGDATFDLSMSIDEFTAPSMSMKFFVSAEPTTYKGIANPTKNAQMYAFTNLFHKMRVSLEGQTINNFELISISMYYMLGAYRR